MIELGLERARHRRAIVNADAVAVTPIDANFNERAGLRPTAPELDQVEPHGIKFSVYNGFQRFVHVTSRAPHKNKKMWGASPTFPRATTVATRIQGTRAGPPTQLKNGAAAELRSCEIPNAKRRSG